VVVDQREQVVPTFNELTLGPILDKLKLLLAPSLLNSVDEVLKDSLSTRLGQNVVDDLLSAKKISRPQVEQDQVLVFGADSHLRKKVSPMLRLHGVVSQVGEYVVHLLVVLDMLNVLLIDLVRPEPIGEVSHLILFDLERLFDSLVHVDLERSLVNLVDGHPNFLDLLPN